MTVLEARGFTQKDFARHHPSGAIGRALLVQVRDIMRTGDRNAVAPQTLLVRDALLVMTRAKSGSLALVDRRGKLAGVFTDGDFRRRMSTDQELLTRPLAEVMTRNPICIRDDALAAEALKITSKSLHELGLVDEIVPEPLGGAHNRDRAARRRSRRGP